MGRTEAPAPATVTIRVVEAPTVVAVVARPTPVKPPTTTAGASNNSMRVATLSPAKSAGASEARLTDSA